MFLKFLLVLFLLFPYASHAQVIFSEIAWMGTDTDANDEWIELYNMSGTDTDVTGWTITLNENPFITLVGIIPPHGVAVLERTDDNAVPGTAFQIYAGALANGGVALEIKDSVGVVTDTVVSGTNWVDIGGSNVVPKMTPQRTRTASWVTGVPTPGADNVQVDDTPSLGTEDDGETEDTHTSSVNGSSHTRSGGGSTQKKVVADAAPILLLTVTAPRIAYVNQEISFDAVPSGIGQTLMRSLSYTWNFGDTYTGKGKTNTHVFQYPGEYVVVAEAEFAKQKAMVRHEITVLPISLTLSRATNGDILLKNGSKQEVDLGGFTLQGTSGFIFPKFTFLKAGGVLIIAAQRINVASGDAVALFDTQHALVVRDGFAATSKEVIVAAPKPMVQKKATAVSATFADAPEVATSETVTEVASSAEEVVATIPIGHLATTDGTSPGFFKSLFSRVFNFFGL